MNVILKLSALLLLLLPGTRAAAQQPVPQRPRVLISTDIGGTDPDDNQSMAHLLMYNDLFDIEGIVSSPSYGRGSKAEILRMIDLYEQDYPRLRRHSARFATPQALRQICKQGRRGRSPYRGYSSPTEGSQWIVSCARKKSDRPLWILVWGTTEDLAQALHDAPDIVDKIRVYYIGGPNKKWGANSYAYIAARFPQLWMIENNASYRGFITDNDRLEYIENFGGSHAPTDKYRDGYYRYAIQGAGALGADFAHYYQGVVKMGDSPSLFYLMDGDPGNPRRESWGGSFEPLGRSARRIVRQPLDAQTDTVPVYAVMEFHFRGPDLPIAEDSVCFHMTIDRQTWNGYYLGQGDYALRYAPKAPARLTYEVSSPIGALDGLRGSFLVSAQWPGPPSEDDYRVGPQWFSDCSSPLLFEGRWQGARTVSKWRTAILEDWRARWSWLR